jgi:hypothetical protein
VLECSATPAGLTTTQFRLLQWCVQYAGRAWITYSHARRWVTSDVEALIKHGLLEESVGFSVAHRVSYRGWLLTRCKEASHAGAA